MLSPKRQNRRESITNFRDLCSTCTTFTCDHPISPSSVSAGAVAQTFDFLQTDDLSMPHLESFQRPSFSFPLLISKQSSTPPMLLGSPDMKFWYEPQDFPSSQIQVPSEALSLPPIQMLLSTRLRTKSFSACEWIVTVKAPWPAQFVLASNQVFGVWINL